ncbi:MAG: glycosyltransferase family 1 protein [Candidatus Nanohalarchaeota archaeon]|nr:MAG: glycosyltransferase family 1 protein [Candidatus Nanohaloarchaeota archaeon]
MKWWGGDSSFVRDKIHYHGVCKCKNLYNKDKRRSIREAIKFSLHLIPHFLKNNYDLIDSNEFPYLPNFIVKLYCLFRRKPMIITWHEVWGHQWYDYLGPHLYIIGILIEKGTVKLPDMIIANSRKTKKDLVSKLGVRKEKIVIVQPTVPINLSQILPSPEKYDLLFCGRLIKEKNVELLIKAMKNLNPNVTCAIIGDGPEKKKLKSLVKTHKLEDRIEFLGFLRCHDDVLSYMKSSKLFIFPSLREGFGTAVLEANACGLPVIVVDGDHNASKHLIEDRVNGFICKNDVESLSKKITYLLNKEELRKKMAKNCKKIFSRHQQSESAQKIEKIYKRFAKRKLTGHKKK